MNKKRGTVWKNFFILMSFISVLILCITFLIYRNAISVMREEICNVNMNQASQLENNIVALIEQTNRLAASLCVQQGSTIFWGIEDPERLDDDFYIELGAILKGYVYSMRNSISSIVLYSPVYNRMLDQDMTEPYILGGKAGKSILEQPNIGWIEHLTGLEKERVKDKIIIRAVNDSYPYVMTIIKQYAVGDKWGAVAIDINLEKAYSVIWPKAAEGTSVWVLDEEGKVIIREKKNELSMESAQFQELALFRKTADEISVIVEERENPVTYSQRFNDTYGLYIITVSELENFNEQMHAARLEAVGIGFGCVVVACFLVWLYVTFATKPIMNILNLLQDPVNYQQYTDQSEREVQEIVDYIVSNLQTNNALQNELEKRVDLLHHTQLQALKAQINPHFLFNTLNVIVMLIDAEVEDSTAAQVTANLADVLHYSLSDEDLVMLEDELEHTRKYVYILEQRYKGRFKTYFDIAPELLKIKVPKLTLQPLIENAVFHGIAAKDICEDGILKISGSKYVSEQEGEEKGIVCLLVEDNGRGMSQEEIERVSTLLMEENITMSHIGVQNVAKRLALLFPQKSKIEITSEQGKGTCVELSFPYVKL